jgi:hypothetical protein
MKTAALACREGNVGCKKIVNPPEKQADSTDPVVTWTGVLVK